MKNYQHVLQSLMMATWVILFLTGCSVAAPDRVSEAPAVTSTPVPPTPQPAGTPTATSEPTHSHTPEPTVTPDPTFTPTPGIPPSETPEPTNLPITELRLKLRNSKGEPVPFAKAELLVDAWVVETEQLAFPLETDGDLLVLPLEEEVAQKTWLKDAPFSAMSYFLYLEADGYVPVRSKEMYFIGTPTREDGPTKEVAIEFYNGPKTMIAKGETKEIELPLREPQNRSLLFVDDAQNPVPGVKVKSYMFWSNSNHCGYADGARLLAEGISDTEGRVAIPDGDFEYLLEFEKPLYHLKETSHFDPMTLITYLSGQEPVIELHKLRKQSLKMVVQEKGKPQANKTLFGDWIGCPCGLCDREIATTDDKGKISLDEFYPEEWSRIFFSRANQSRGGFAWDADPKGFLGTETIEVELSE